MDIMDDLEQASKEMESLGPVPESIEVHPMQFREIVEAIRDQFAFSPVGCPVRVYGVRILENPKLKPWAGIVRDRRGRVMQVMRFVNT